MKQDEIVTFIKTLQAHRGELIQLKDQLFWFGGRGWDGQPGRICLILDVGGEPVDNIVKDVDVDAAISLGYDAVVQLLIEGSPKWVYVNKQSVQFILDDQLSNLDGSVHAHDIS